MSMKGKKHTEQAKEKISRALKGRKLSRKHIEKLRKAIKGKRLGENAPNWKGGRIRDRDGYAYLRMLEHPHATQNGYIFEHRYVMEQHLGRYLESWEMVHHRNGIKDDNRIENLEILIGNGGTHMGKIRCPFCKRYFYIR